VPSILVVDDDPDVGRALKDLLGANGHPAALAQSGEEALERLAAEPADLVLLDARLPGLTGFETCERIRERHGPSLPVLMVTAFGDQEAVRQAARCGADDLIQKPVDTPSLLLKVRAFLRMKSLHDELLESREEAQDRVRDLALLHEIGRDWSLIDQPEEFHRVVSQRLASLIGAPICLIALYDPATRVMAAALPVHGLSDQVARGIRYTVKPEYRGLWNFRSGRPYVSNQASSDQRLIQEIVRSVGAESVVLVPMMSEGRVLGLVVAVNKPGGFTDADVQLLTVFAGPAATFLRSRQIFERQKRHAARLERLSDLMGAMGATMSRNALIELAVSRMQKDLGYERVAFWSCDADGGLRREVSFGSERPAEPPLDMERLKWALRSGTPLEAADAAASELTVPVRAGEQALGILDIFRVPGAAFDEEEVKLLQALGGQLALALQRAASLAETERLARQMATLYDVGLETGALRDLRLLFVKAAEEAGRLIKADHTSVLRVAEEDGTLKLFAAWGRDLGREPYAEPVFKVGEGIAGRVARDRIPVIINDADLNQDFVPRANPVSRLLCVPLSYYDHEREAPTIFGVLNSTRKPGAPPFTADDLEYLTRFAGQLSIAVANSMAFAAERERSEQLSLVNALQREIAGNLSRDRIFKTAVRRIQEAFRYPVVMIGVPDPETGLTRIAAAAVPGGEKQGFGSRPAATGIVGRAYREQRTILVPDVSKDPDYLRVFPGTKSEVAVPIRSGADVVAVLNVESDAFAAFDRGEVITLETLADGIGITLRNAELFQAVERTNAKLVELDRLKSELVNIVAHDFRSPLAGVLGYAELLEWKPDAPREERIESARAIISAATHMSSLVDKTLKTSRLETGQFPFEFGVVNLAAIAREVVERQPVDELHPLSASIPDDPVPCWADRDRLTEVLENLISNAIKYSPKGGTVHLEMRSEAEVVTVQVVDRGLGIAAADLRRLFRPFSRVRNQGTAAIEGSGLGLYICERIVRAHGGRLEAESLPGQGSSFAFSLPVFGVAAQARVPLLLVAAADEGTRREVGQVAESLGYALHEAADGVEAVEAGIRLLPAVVVLDRVLPRLGAEEVAARLRDNEATAGVALIALAAESDLGTRAGWFRARVPKPIDRPTLAAALESLSGEARQSMPAPRTSG
jgi:signal transduction histidine kinase/DNA-binding response OmpR family regulator